MLPGRFLLFPLLRYATESGFPCLRDPHPNNEQGEEVQQGSDAEGREIAPPLKEETADDRTAGEPERIATYEHSHPAGSMLFRHQVSNHAHGRREHSDAERTLQEAKHSTSLSQMP